MSNRERTSDEEQIEKSTSNQEATVGALEEIYPNAIESFFFRPRKLKDIKEDCLVVLDTNVLLIPFKTGKNSLSEIRQTYAPLIAAERLFIPAHVIREYSRNRTDRVKDLYQQIASKRDVNVTLLKTADYPLLSELHEFQEVVRLESEIKKAVELMSTYRNTVGKLLDCIKDWAWNDPITLLYQELFSVQHNVIREASIKPEKLRLDLERRNNLRIPPGYHDSGKPINAEGDLLIWHTILELGEETQCDVIFISGDEKNDWRCRSNNQSLYARHELLDEFRRRSSGKTFHIVDFSQFLDLFGASADVVAEVKNAEEAEAAEAQLEARALSFLTPSARRHVVASQLEHRIYHSLSNINSDCHFKISQDQSFVDFWIFDPNGERLPVSIKYVARPSRHTLVSIVGQAQEWLNTHDCERLMLIIGSDNPSVISRYQNFLMRDDQSIVDKDSTPVLLAQMEPDGKISYPGCYGSYACRWITI